MLDISRVLYIYLISQRHLSSRKHLWNTRLRCDAAVSAEWQIIINKKKNKMEKVWCDGLKARRNRSGNLYCAHNLSSTSRETFSTDMFYCKGSLRRVCAVLRTDNWRTFVFQTVATLLLFHTAVRLPIYPFDCPAQMFRCLFCTHLLLLPLSLSSSLSLARARAKMG